VSDAGGAAGGPGTLYLVATPIGNLGDITLRALEILRAVDAVACEDTRRTRQLLSHFEIHKPLLAVPAHDEARRASAVVARLAQGASVAFVTDAGMPAVSDPGVHLVAAALEAGAKVVPIPGPSAALAALAASGLDTSTFHFLGFLPRKGRARRDLVAAAAAWPGAVVLLEAPGRLPGTLADLAAAFGDGRRAAVCRELTKLHEEITRGTLGELAERYAGAPRGEITLVIAGAGSRVAAEEAVPLADAVARVAGRVAAGERLKDACKVVAEETGHAVRALYQAALAES
jgi:16S rRNA (cytidine1402-2'-O)-methyltransferase